MERTREERMSDLWEATAAAAREVATWPDWKRSPLFTDAQRARAERRECVICGRRATPHGTEPRCEEHRSE